MYVYMIHKRGIRGEWDAICHPTAIGKAFKTLTACEKQKELENKMHFHSITLIGQYGFP